MNTNKNGKAQEEHSDHQPEQQQSQDSYTRSSTEIPASRATTGRHKTNMNQEVREAEEKQQQEEATINSSTSADTSKRKPVVENKGRHKEKAKENEEKKLEKETLKCNENQSGLRPENEKKPTAISEKEEEFNELLDVMQRVRDFGNSNPNSSSTSSSHKSNNYHNASHTEKGKVKQKIKRHKSHEPSSPKSPRNYEFNKQSPTTSKRDQRLAQSLTEGVDDQETNLSMKHARAILIQEYDQAVQEEKEEEEEVEGTSAIPHHPSTQENATRTSGFGSSYEARLARKQQREMAVTAATETTACNESSMTSIDATTPNVGYARAPQQDSTTASSSSSTIPSNIQAMGKRAMLNDVQAEIAAAQARSRAAREVRKTSSIETPSSTMVPLPPPIYGSLSSSKATASAHSTTSTFTAGSTISTRTNDHNESSHNESHQDETSAGDRVAVTGTVIPTSSLSSSLQRQSPREGVHRTSSADSTVASQSLPGAYPTAGRAPFANPYMGGRYRGGSDGENAPPATLFGEPVLPPNSERSGSTNNPTNYNDSMSSSALMNDHSLSSFAGGGSSVANPQRRREQPTALLGSSSSSLINHSFRREMSLDSADGVVSLDDHSEIVAVCVEEDDLENNIRDEIIRSAAQADVVSMDDSENKRLNHSKILACVIAILIILAVAIGIGVGYFVLQNGSAQSSDDEFSIGDDGTATIAPTLETGLVASPTLERVYQDGVLRCGIYETTGFDEESGDRFGVDVDWCRAVAAAVMGKDEYGLLLVNVTFGDRFQLIADGTIDVLAASSTYTMDRNVYESTIEKGLHFSIPYMYDGMRFAGIPHFVECADDDMKNFFECRELEVCVVRGSSYHGIIASRLPKRQIHLVDGWQTLYGGLRDGICNVIAAEGVSIGEANVRAFGYTGNYTVGRSLYSKIPFSIVTRNNDPQWSDFINVVMQTVIAAEEMGITQSTSKLARQRFISGASLFGKNQKNMFEDILAVIGNFAELYERHAASAVAREGLALLNNGSTGLLFNYPFGLTLNEGAAPKANSTLDRIMTRGYLRCAIRTGRPGFAEVIKDFATTRNHPANQNIRNESAAIIGLDIDYCRALATSIFSGSVHKVEFTEIQEEKQGYALLAKDAVDVVAGSLWTLQNDVKEPLTGQGYAFSQPYFYGSDTGSKNPSSYGDDCLCLVTRQDDHQWASYVFWVVASTFYAEAEGIDQRLSNSMPIVNLFGPDFQRMLRDPILEFGNYGELYARNVEHLVPRGGRNQINTIRNPGPQLHAMPGFAR